MKMEFFFYKGKEVNVVVARGRMDLRGFCVVGEITCLNASGEKWVEREILLI